MMHKAVSLKPTLISSVVAALLWFVIFVIKPFNFWVEMSVAILLLSAIAVYYERKHFNFGRVKFRHVLLGIVSAVLLYFVFYFGNIITGYVLPFKNAQVLSVYSNKAGVDARLIGFLLLFIIGPGEELYWRGFIQNSISKRFGSLKGYLLAAGLYAGVHILTGNFMLIVAALICGLFWGFIYKKEESLWPVIISHAIWDFTIFLLFPLM